MLGIVGKGRYGTLVLLLAVRFLARDRQQRVYSVEKLARTPVLPDCHKLWANDEGMEMMGQQASAQDQLFYSFNLDAHIPSDHLLRGSTNKQAAPRLIRS